jgi:hypothetical protein
MVITPSVLVGAPGAGTKFVPLNRSHVAAALQLPVPVLRKSPVVWAKALPVLKNKSMRLSSFRNAGRIGSLVLMVVGMGVFWLLTDSGGEGWAAGIGPQ